MTDRIYYHEKKAQNDATVSVIFYNSVHKQHVLNRSIQKRRDTGCQTSSWFTILGRK